MFKKMQLLKHLISTTVTNIDDNIYKSSCQCRLTIPENNKNKTTHKHALQYITQYVQALSNSSIM